MGRLGAAGVPKGSAWNSEILPNPPRLPAWLWIFVSSSSTTITTPFHTPHTPRERVGTAPNGVVDEVGLGLHVPRHEDRVVVVASVAPVAPVETVLGREDEIARLVGGARKGRVCDLREFPAWACPSQAQRKATAGFPTQDCVRLKVTSIHLLSLCSCLSGPKCQKRPTSPNQLDPRLLGSSPSRPPPAEAPKRRRWMWSPGSKLPMAERQWSSVRWPCGSPERGGAKGDGFGVWGGDGG